MKAIDVFVWGIIQGITEFVPVSSDGHLVVIPRLLGLVAPDIFTNITLHIGTFVSILIFFRKDIAALFTKAKRRAALIIIATLPLLLAGLIFEDRVGPLFESPRLTGWMFLINGMVLFAAQAGSRGLIGPVQKEMNLWQALIIGLSQPFALLPGISRSGTTIAAAICSGVEKEDAFKFSFLLFLPAGILVFLYDLMKFSSAQLNFEPAAAAGALLSAVVGLFALRFLFDIIRKSRLYVLGIYCVILGIITLCVFR